MKIAVIGGGSTYTPELIDGFVSRSQSIPITEVCLHDIDPVRLRILGDFSRRIVSAGGAAFTVSTTQDLQEAVEGARFVLIEIRVGGQQARHQDILLGLRHNLIGQETTGIGGFAKALRTVPVVLDICAQVERHAPEAWVLNFTNPAGLVTEAILHHTPLKAIGLCNIPLDVKMSIAKEISIPPEGIRLDYVGLNHLAWLRKVIVDGKDILPDIMDQILRHGTPKNIPDFDFDPDLVRALGMFPMYYLRYYYSTHRMLRLLREKSKTRAEEVMEIEQTLLRLYQDPAVNTKPDLLEQRGGAYYSVVAVELIEALGRTEATEHVVNVRNGNALPELPEDSVVELPARISSAGASPLPAGPLEPAIRGLIQVVKAYEQLAIRAAVERDFDAALLALITHPLGPTADDAREVLDDLLTTNGLPFNGHSRS